MGPFPKEKNPKFTLRVAISTPIDSFAFVLAVGKQLCGMIHQLPVFLNTLKGFGDVEISFEYFKIMDYPKPIEAKPKESSEPRPLYRFLSEAHNMKVWEEFWSSVEKDYGTEEKRESDMPVL